MPTATARDDRPAQALRFALQGVAWALGLFGLLRLGWFEAHAVLPLTQFQARLAESGFGTPALPIQVTLACSGADALALCAGAILAYPALWRRRLQGAATGVALILTLNVVRIGTLGRAAGSAWFDALHVYVWPALLTLAIAGYVFAWMRHTDGRAAASAGGRHAAPAVAVAAGLTRAPGASALPLTPRFVAISAAAVMIFIAASPLYLESSGVLAVAAFTARAAAWGLGLLGVQATAAGNVLSTSHGGFLVTQECLSTPLIPVYFAAAWCYSNSRRRLALALFAAVPIFIGLGVARLLIVALPIALVGSPMFLIHAFYQLALAAVVVVLAAVWRHGGSAAALHRALLGVVLGGVLVYLLGPSSSRALASVSITGTPLDDPQGALAFLPVFQVGLYLALSVAAFAAFNWRPFATGLALLGLSQVILFAALHVVMRHAGLVPHVRDLRAWAVAAPLLLVAAMVADDRPRR